MIFAVRLAVITLAAFAAAGLVGVCLVPLLARKPGKSSARAHARALFALRMTPVTASFGTSLLIALSFLFFEPRTNLGETPGYVLDGLAAVGGVLLIGSLCRGLLLIWRARRAYDVWLRTAEPLEVTLPSRIPAVAVNAPFPIVAVFGVFRPRLVIARSVLAHCSPDELSAVMAHEESHVLHGDNLRRALITLAPDLLGWSPVGGRIAESWHEASEEAADEAADRLGPEGRATLAQALLRIARLAPPGHALEYLPTSALYRGENIDRRVRRLLAVAVPAPPPQRFVTELGTVLGVALVSVVVFGVVQQVIELAMIALP